MGSLASTPCVIFLHSFFPIQPEQFLMDIVDQTMARMIIGTPFLHCTSTNLLFGPSAEKEIPGLELI